MPRAILVPGERFHIYNRGHNKQNIFLDTADYSRMLFCLLFYQATTITIYNIAKIVAAFRKQGTFSVPVETIQSLYKKRDVELEIFSLMPNHFHIGVRALGEGAVSAYLQKVEIAYTKYFNIRYGRSGYLFQGPFQSVHIENNEQFLHLSAYIHRNACELSKWRNKEHLYPWSSLQDYVGQNRWGDLLSKTAIVEQFEDEKEYHTFVRTSGTKDFDDLQYSTS